MTPIRDGTISPAGTTPLETLSMLAVAANTGGTLAGALPSLLELLCRSGGWNLGHAYRVALDGDQVLPLDTWWPASAAGFEPFRHATAGTAIRRDGLVRAIRESAGPVWIDDIDDAGWYLRRAGALESGLRSTLAFPVMGPGGMAAMIELLGREVRPVEPERFELARHAGIVIGQVLQRESLEGRFRALFDHLPIPVGVTTVKDGTFVEANLALTEFCGRSRQEMLGSTPEQLGMVVEGWDREERIRELLDGLGSHTTETTIRTEVAGDRQVIAGVSVIPWEGSPHLLASLMDVTTLRSTAHQLGRSRAQVHALSSRLIELQEEERAHLSRELHDQLGQRLSVLKIIVDRLRRAGADRALTTEAGEITRGLIDDVRWMSFELRPAVLDQLGLAAAIRRYVERTTASTSLSVELQVDDSVPSASDVTSTTCFRILQEAVTNVLRHADATHLRIELSLEGDDTLLSVADDGHGFDVSEAEHVMGLRIMRERAESVGGSLRVSSGIDVGTRVDVCLPASEERPPGRWSAP